MHREFRRMVQLKAITTKIGSGATPRGGERAYKQSGIALIRSLNVYDLYFDANKLAYIDETQASGLASATVAPDDILFNITGSVARCTLVPLEILPARVNQHVAIIRVDKSKACPQFVQYVLVSPHYKNSLLSLVTGATRIALTKTTLENFQIPLPPLETQRKIAAILSAYDELIENNNKRIKLLEQATHDLYREWFVHLRFPGHEDVAMVDSGTNYGMIPQGWEVCLLSNIIDTQYGYTESTQNEPVGPKFLRGMDINKTSYIDWSQVPYCPITVEVFEKFKLNFGDVLMIRMADPGKVAIVEQNDIDAVFASYLVRWKIKHSTLTPYFLFYFLMSEEYQSHISGASTGTTRKSASAKVMTGKEILIPTQWALQRFDDFILPLRRELNNLLERNAVLRPARDLLLPRLVSGELDVSERDIQGATF